MTLAMNMELHRAETWRNLSRVLATPENRQHCRRMMRQAALWWRIERGLIKPESSILVDELVRLRSNARRCS